MITNNFKINYHYRASQSRLHSQPKRIKTLNFGRIDYPSYLDPDYTSPKSINNTVVMLGASTDVPAFRQPTIDIAKEITKSGRNCLHGGAKDGLMGNIIEGAKTGMVSAFSGKNLGILIGYDNEVPDQCKVIGTGKSEAERIGHFKKAGKTFVFLPSGAGGTGELADLISHNVYEPDKKEIILFGKDEYEHIIKHYESLHQKDRLKVHPKELFKVTDSVKELMQLLPKIM